jgi:hypothetical protein
MSQLEVDKIIPQSGTTLTIGDSGDTVNFADGTNLSIDTNTLFIDSTNNRVGIANASPSVALDVTGAAKVSGDLAVDTNTLKVDSSNNRVGILTSSPAKTLQVLKSDDYALRVGASNYYWDLGSISGSSPKLNAVGTSTSAIFEINGSEKMRIDSSGNVLVGKTSQDSGATVGTEILSGRLFLRRSGGAPIIADRDTSDGEIITFKRAGTTVGFIGTLNNDLFICSSASGHTGLSFANINRIFATNNSGTPTDNVADLGATDTRFANLYLGGGLYVGGTGTANKLDDYEEGTWSPSIQASGNHFSSITFGNRIGYYTKVGRLVTAHFRVNCSAVTVGSATGALQVENLPFTASNLNTNLSHAGSLYSLDHINFDPAGTFGTANIGLRTNANDNKGTIKIVRNNNASAGVAADTAINSNSEIEGVLIYFVD